MKNFLTRFINQTLMFTMLGMSIWVPVAQATLVSTDQVAGVQATQQDRERVRAFFDREDVQAQLHARGVSSESAKARVDSMTDSEIASINGHLDDLPAGGTDILGFFLLIFVILLITDILGLTKVFPFTKRL
ncbi:MAG: PA2779 family protein [Gallionellaceae bacterium]|jgi:hypothetical protein